MKKIFSFLKFKKEKKEDFLILDIGSSGIKGLILEKEGRKKRVNGFASKSFEKFGIFQTTAFEKELLEKTISDVIKKLKLRGQTLTKKRISKMLKLIAVNPEILKGRIPDLSFQKTNPEKIIDKEEEKIILDLILNKAQKKVAERFQENHKIALNEIQVLKKEVIETKISGYKVSSILGQKGKIFDFRVLIIFTLKNYLKIFSLIKKFFVSEKTIFAHEIEGLISWLKNKKNFSGTFIDIGSRFTQIFLVKNGLLKWIGEFEVGGDIFTEALSKNLGLTQKEAEDLKLRFSKGELSSGSKKIIKGILAQPLNFWFNKLKQEFEECGNKIHFVFPQDFYLFGGGSLLPGIKKILRDGNWDNLPILNSTKIKSILPKDFPIEDKSGFLTGSQEVGIIFLALSI